MSDYAPRDRPDPNALSPEETHTLKKCLDGSFLTHSVPAMLGGFAVLKVLSNKGYRTGFFLKGAAIISSGVLGRLTAVPKCLEMTINQYPDGNLAAQMKDARERRYRNRDPRFTPDESHPHEQMSVAEHDTIARSPSPSPPGQSQQTYDDLRRKNREQFMSRRTAQSPPVPPLPSADQPQQSTYSNTPPDMSSYSDPPSPYSDHTPLVPPASSMEDEPKVRRRKRVNIYGDEIED